MAFRLIPRTRVAGAPAAAGRLPAALAALLLLLAADAGAQVGGGERPVVRIGVVWDGLRDPDAEIVGTAMQRRMWGEMRKEILAITREDFDVRFPEEKVAEGGWTVAGIREGIQRLLSDPGVDIVLTVGAFGTHLACRMEELPKPVIAPFAIEPTVQRLPRSGEGSGVRNLSYVTVPTNFVQDMERFHRLVGFDRVHVLHDALKPEVIDDLNERVRELAGQMGFEAIPAPVGTTPEDALSALPPGTEAVYLAPLLRMREDAFQAVIDGLKARKIPSYTIMGRPDVERGIMASSNPGTSAGRLARRVALNLHRILLGESPSQVPVEIEGDRRLTINMETARAIGWYPDWRTALEADLLFWHDAAEAEPLSLEQAVGRAVEANLGLEARALSVEASRENIRSSRSALLPQVGLSARALQIDDDRAALSFGSQPERSVTGGARLSQVLWSDGALAGLSIEKDLQAGRDHDLAAARLDIALAASTAFLDLLRAETLHRIEESNLALTESNLRLARRRRSVGVTGPAEVYRWESRLATDKSNVLQAYSRMLSVRTTLNRLLNQPLERGLRPADPSVTSPGFLGEGSPLHRYVSNERSFRIFREFIVQEGLGRAPELRSLDAAIRAQERALTAATRSYWSPDLSFTAEWARRLSESGEGSEPLDLFGLGTSSLEANETTWSLGVGLAIPLLTSGARPAEVARASRSLARLRMERSAARQRIEERLRVSVFATVGTWPNIELSAEAADASRKNLELITEMYAEGVVSIIDLLDAQNAALVAEQVSANAVFDFLIDLMEIQRASSNFEFFLSAEEREAWFKRLDDYAAAWNGTGDLPGATTP